jgi:UTP--glucose-1-phosphate uridylyltransferase
MLSETARRDMARKGVDAELSIQILNDYNSGKIGQDPRIVARDIPDIDGKSVIDLQGPVLLRIDSRLLKERLSAFGIDCLSFESSGSETILDRSALERIGLDILPFTAFGILTGGGATTYADHKRNRALDPGLFGRFEAEFERAAEMARGRPKGVVPAFMNPDGSPGPSYLRLKQRALLLMVREWEAAESARRGRQIRGCEAPAGGFPLRPFQMASVGNAAELGEYLARAADDELTAAPMRNSGCDVGRFLTGVQPMIAAFSHSCDGKEKQIFSGSGGEKDSVLALPGGHGQNFRFLKDIYRGLRAEGKRYAYLCNVDNLGALPSRLELGIMAATGKQAGFDFSFRTPMDVKGGILVRDSGGQLTCGDIGAAISFEDVLSLESRGKRVLFNCATGLFDLEWLCGSLEGISAKLPMRFSDQDKDSGRYSQAEQNTWEVIGLLDDFSIFAVDKAERFLSAKMLMEMILMSFARPGVVEDPVTQASPAWETAKQLNKGLEDLLISRYGLAESSGRWSAST